MDFDVVDDAILKLKTHTNNEEGTLTKINACLTDISTCYTGNESRVLSNSNKVIARNFPMLITNRRAYIIELKTNRINYEAAAIYTLKIFQTDDSKDSGVK